MDPNTIDPLALVGLAGVPFVIGLTEMVKTTVPETPSRLYPLISLTWAITINVGFALYRHSDPIIALFVATVVGLAASGLYSGVKTAKAG